MSETTPIDTELKTILTKEYRWSTYSFLVNLASFSTLTVLICVLMQMHKIVPDGHPELESWIIIVVGVSLEVFFAGLSALDAYRRNPSDRNINSRIFNLPVFSIAAIIIAVIFWGQDIQLTIVYGGICGGFSGYLAGGLAYANFFIHIKDIVYRTIFGGWVGTFLGAIFGALIAGLVDPVFGEGFGGIFMGFWGGAIVSGPIATALLYYLKDKKKFTDFFSKVQYDGPIRELRKDLVIYFESNSKIKELHLKDTVLYQEIVEKDVKLKDESDKTNWNKLLRGLLFILFLISPWLIRDEAQRIIDNNLIVDFALENTILTREEDIVKKAE